MERLLVVDDESEMVLVLKKFLTREGFSVSSANNGNDALKSLEKKGKIDLMILDMKMPGIKGIDVLQILRDKKLDLPVIVLTGSLNFSGFVEKMESLGYSKEDVLFKPVSLFELLSVIYKKLGKDSQKLGQKKAALMREIKL